jgi:hypothetical protein
MPSFRAFQEEVCRQAESVGKGFTDRDDDWEPFAILDCRDGRRLIMALRGDKELYGVQVAKVAKRRKALKVARVHSSWEVAIDPATLTPAERARLDRNEYPRGRPSEHHERREILVVLVMDAERCEGWVAEIRRDGVSPPTLGPWESSSELGGKQVEPIAEALR